MDKQGYKKAKKWLGEKSFFRKAKVNSLSLAAEIDNTGVYKEVANFKFGNTVDEWVQEIAKQNVTSKHVLTLCIARSLDFESTPDGRVFIMSGGILGYNEDNAW